MANILAWLAIYNICTVNSSDTNGSGIESSDRSGRQESNPRSNDSMRGATQRRELNKNPEHASSSNTTANVLSTGMVTKTCLSKGKAINIISGAKETKIVVYDALTRKTKGYKIKKTVTIEGNGCECIRTKALSEIQEELASCSGERFTEKMPDHCIAIIQLGLIFGNEIEKKLAENKQHISMDKLQGNDRKNMVIKSNGLFKNKNSDKMNKIIYENKSRKDIILEILLFFYDHPEMLRNNRNEQYHVSHDVVKTALIDYFAEKDTLVVHVFTSILEFKGDSSIYVDVLDRCCYSVVVSLSVNCLNLCRAEMYKAVEKIEKELKNLYEEHNVSVEHFTGIIIKHVENFEFIEDSVKYFFNKLYEQIRLHTDNIWKNKCLDVAEHAKVPSKDDIYSNFLPIVNNRMLHLKETFDIMLKGHSNLCKLFNIKFNRMITVQNHL